MVEISETRKSQHCISNLSEVSELFQNTRSDYAQTSLSL